MKKTEFTDYQRQAFESEAHLKSGGETMSDPFTASLDELHNWSMENMPLYKRCYSDPELRLLCSQLLVHAFDKRRAQRELDDDRQVTHWEDCFKDPKHHACALAVINVRDLVVARLKRELRQARAIADKLAFSLLHQQPDGYHCAVCHADWRKRPRWDLPLDERHSWSLEQWLDAEPEVT